MEQKDFFLDVLAIGPLWLYPDVQTSSYKLGPNGVWNSAIEKLPSQVSFN